MPILLKSMPQGLMQDTFERKIFIVIYGNLTMRYILCIRELAFKKGENPKAWTSCQIGT